MPWSAESPYLYTLVINSTDRNGKVQESVAQPFGFRSVEMKNGQLLVNGYGAMGLEEEQAGTAASMTLVAMSALLLLLSSRPIS